MSVFFDELQENVGQPRGDNEEHVQHPVVHWREGGREGRRVEG